MTLPLWTVLPFLLLLVSIALLPQIAAEWWSNDWSKLTVCLAAALPAAILLGVFRGPEGVEQLRHALEDYFSFVTLLAALYVIASGLVVEGGFKGTPRSNVALLATGAALASLVGTMGASVILIRPLLRANAWRAHRSHQVIFFILLVSNVGGLLTALGDPPLFLGFLRGVPFAWTLETLWNHWAFAVTFLLLGFYCVDRVLYEQEPTGAQPEAADALRVRGLVSFLFLALVLLSIVGRRSGALASVPFGGHELFLITVTSAAWATSSRDVREANGFSWKPIREVGLVFLGLFVTMTAPVLVLNSHSSSLGLREPWQFFWATGLLSSWLDNAPTYLTFASAAAGLLDVDASQRFFLAELLGRGEPGPSLLRAISCGAVLMGAFTYIGNAPNLVVKLIADEDGVPMPSFFGYFRWSAAILLPLFLLMTWIFLS